MISFVTADGVSTQVDLAKFEQQSHVIASMELKEGDVVPLPLIPTAERLLRLVNQYVGSSIQETIDTANDADYLHHSLLERCRMRLSNALTTEDVDDLICQQLVPDLLQRVVTNVDCKRALAFRAHSLEQMSDSFKWILTNSNKLHLEKTHQWRLSALLIDFIDWSNDDFRAAYDGDISYFRSLRKLPGRDSFCWSIALLKNHMEIVYMGLPTNFDLARHVAKSADEAVWKRLGKDAFARLSRSDCRTLVRESVRYSNVVSYVNFQRLYRAHAKTLLPLNEYPSLCMDVEIDGQVPELTREADIQRRVSMDDDGGFMSFGNYMNDVHHRHKVCSVNDIIFKPNMVRKMVANLRERDAERIRSRGRLFESMKTDGCKLETQVKTIVGYLRSECPITDEHVRLCEETLQILDTMYR